MTMKQKHFIGVDVLWNVFLDLIILLVLGKYFANYNEYRKISLRYELLISYGIIPTQMVYILYRSLRIYKQSVIFRFKSIDCMIRHYSLRCFWRITLYCVALNFMLFMFCVFYEETYIMAEFIYLLLNTVLQMISFGTIAMLLGIIYIKTFSLLKAVLITILVILVVFIFYPDVINLFVFYSETINGIISGYSLSCSIFVLSLILFLNCKKGDFIEN